MKRVTVQEVQAAYAETEFKPREGMMWRRNPDTGEVDCGCAWGVLYLAAHPTDLIRLQTGQKVETCNVHEWAKANYGEWYFAGFQGAFDGYQITEDRWVREMAGGDPDAERSWRTGHADGLAARLAMGIKGATNAGTPG